VRDGTAALRPASSSVRQTATRSASLSYRTRVGNDLEGNDYGYKIHLCTALPPLRR